MLCSVPDPVFNEICRRPVVAPTMVCADHRDVYTRKGICELFIKKNLAFRLETKIHQHFPLLIALRHQNVQLEPEDLQQLDIAQAADYAYFVQLIAFTHPKFSSSWAPELWRAAILKGWEWRARLAPLAVADQVSYKMFASMIRTPEDLRAALAILSDAHAPLNPLFAATRPPYMSQQGELLDTRIGDLTYGPIFEEILETRPEITTMLPSEVDALFLSCWHLPNLSGRAQVLKARWAYEREKIWDARRRRFKAALREDIIATACRPARIARLIEEHGFDAVTDNF